MSSLPRIPVRARYSPRISESERQRIAERARRLLAGEPGLNATQAFGRDIRSGLIPGTGLFFEDHFPLQLVKPEEGALLDYRVRMLADSGDILVLAGQPHAGFDAYCRDIVGLGNPVVVSAGSPPGQLRSALAERCRKDRPLLERIASLARDAGGLTVFPYVTCGHDWLLAGDIARLARVPVRVAAAPPRLSRRVNDKGWFLEQVAWLLGPAAIPPSHVVLGPAALAGRVAHLARRYPRIVLKVPDSAGGRGNLVLDSDEVRSISLRELRRRLILLLHGLGWEGDFPIVAGVWEAPVVASPSAQLWVPARTDGVPVVEGLFVQALTGAMGAFIGAEPAQFPSDVEARVADEAFRLACLFQELGYFGCCSFDAVLVGDTLGSAELHWIECNGRWGGVSIPLTLANRLAGDGPAMPFVVAQQTVPGSGARSFREAIALLSQLLYVRGEQDTGVIVATPRSIEAGSGLQFVALGETVAEARFLAEAARKLLA